MADTEDNKIKETRENMDSTNNPSENQDYISMLGWNIAINKSNYYNADVIQDYPMVSLVAGVDVYGAFITALYQLYNSNVKLNLPTAALVGLISAGSVWYAHNTNKIEENFPLTEGLHSFMLNSGHYFHDSSIFTQDTIYDALVVAKDALYYTGVVIADKMYDGGVVAKDAIYNTGVVIADKMYDGGVVAKDAIYDVACIVANYTTGLAGNIYDNYVYA